MRLRLGKEGMRPKPVGLEEWKLLAGDDKTDAEYLEAFVTYLVATGMCKVGRRRVNSSA